MVHNVLTSFLPLGLCKEATSKFKLVKERTLDHEGSQWNDCHNGFYLGLNLTLLHYV